jgi:hypothetical protein
MPSPADAARGRGQVEGALRGVAAAALVAAIVLAWREDRDTSAAAHARFAAAPDAVTRDSLGARVRAGHRVSWDGALPALALMAEPVREPGDRWRVTVVGEAAMLVRDSLGPVDSLAAGGGVLATEATRGAVQVVHGASVADGRPADVAAVRRVLVLGRVGWEARFVISALEEAGWAVDASLALGRGREVRQGVPAVSRARQGAVIVLDTASLRREGAALARFVRGGGGLILADEAVRGDVPALRGHVGAQVVAVEDAETASFEGHEPTHALALAALRTTRDDAVVLEDREGTPAVVARRVGAGRILQLGYRETWRWRMEGEGRAVEGHRAWWSRLVGSVTGGDYAPRAPLGAAAGNPMPTADLVHALGPATPEGARGGSVRLPAWLAPLLLLALLAEWGSRRARGAA